MNKKKNIFWILLFIVIIVTIISLSLVKIFYINKKNNVPNDLFGTWISNYSYLYVDDKLIDESSSFDNEYIIIDDKQITFCNNSKSCNDYSYKVNYNKIGLSNNKNKDVANDYLYKIENNKLTLTVEDKNMKVITNYVKAEG